MVLNTDLMPPPGGKFSSLEDLQKHLRQWATDHGFGITWNGVSKRNKMGEKIKWSFQCARSGRYKGSSNQTKIRKTQTIKCNCPFKGVVNLVEKEYAYHIIHNQHNHQATGKHTELVGCQLSQADLALIHYCSFTMRKSTPETLEHLLQANPDRQVTIPDVDNAIQKMLREQQRLISNENPR
ncbi:hypothetical protein K3495_g9771 [Podosphaera aphanis]|nr:hypothetical protein K3495_g9771 [Podosphaera aphanis]